MSLSIYPARQTQSWKLLQAAESKGISHKISSDDGGVVSAIYVKVKDGYDIGTVNSRIQTRSEVAMAADSI